MKKRKLKSIRNILGILFIAYLFLGNFNNPPNGRTGAPPTNNTCMTGQGGCHSGGNFNGSVAIAGFPATLMANQTYSITVTVSFASGNPVFGGFQATVQEGNNFVGVFSNPGAGSHLSGNFWEHFPAQSFSGGSVSYTVDWTAPPGPNGATIIMYAAGNIANGNGNTSGDDIRTTTATGTLQGAAGPPTVIITNQTNVSCFGMCDGSATAMASGGAGPPYTYLWSTVPPQNGATAINLCAGPYTVTATDGAGGTATANVTITQPSILVASISNVVHIDCNNPVGSAFATANGGTPGYTFNWSHGQFGQNATFINPGTYMVTATDANLCTDISTVVINANTVPPTAEAGAPGVIDCNNSTATLDGTGSSVGSNFNYLWTGPGIVSGETTLMPVVDAEGTYTLTVTNQTNGCTSSDQTTVAENTTPPAADAGPGMTIDCLNTTVTLDGTNSSQGPNFSYLWTGPCIVSGASTLTPVVDCAGTYTIEVTDNTNGCTSQSNVVVNENTTPPTVAAGTSGQIDCNNAIVTVDGTGSSQGANFSYQWTGPCIVSGADSLMAEVDCGGTYCLIVTDNTNGCTAEACVTVNEDLANPTANSGPGMQIDCNNATVILDGSNSSPAGSISFLWTTTDGNIASGENTANPEVSSAGTYTLEVTNNNNGCTDTDFVVVTEDTNLPAASAGPGMELNCSVTSLTLDGTNSSQGANFSYLWTGPCIVSGANTMNPTVDCPGTYCIEVTDTTNGCVSMDCVVVTENVTLPTSTIAPPGTIDCNNSEITLDGSASSSGANITYNWTTTDGNIVSGTNSNMATVDTSGTYCLLVTNTDNGCTAEFCVVVNEDTVLPTADAGQGMVINCNNPSVTLDGTASSQGVNFSYEWTGPDIQSGGSTLTPTVGAAGTYTLTVTDTNNGCTSEASTEVTETLPPTATTSINNHVDCNGNSTGSATVSVTDGSPPYTYSWSSGGTEATENNLPAGTYSVTANDQDGCTVTDMVTITEPPILVANASATAETSAGASDGTANANPNGGTPGYTYNWNTGDTTQTISGLTPGDYTVTVTDANGCTTEETVTVNSFDCSAVSVNIATTDVSCNGGSDGEATATVVNGSDPIKYNWSTGDTTQTVSNLPAGTYSVTATEGSNCAIIKSVTIEEPPVMSITNISQTNVDCNGNATGSATVEVTGGTPAYTYQWNDPGNQTTATATGLAAGTYMVTVTDVNVCEVVGEVSLSEPPALLPNISHTDETSLGANDGTASANPTGGTPGYTYEWNNGPTSPMISDLMPGSYCVTITDMNGCTATECAEVMPFNCAGVSTTFDGTDASCNGGSDGAAIITTIGGNEPYTYTWSDGGTGASRDDLPAGTFDVTCEDAKHCTTTTSVIIGEPPILEAILISQTNLECEGDMTGTLTAGATGGTQPYNFEWSTGSMDTTITNLGAGNYSLVVTDGNGCSASRMFLITVDPDTLAPTPITQSVNIYLDENGEAIITGEMLDAGTFDNCELHSLNIDEDEFDCEDIGVDTILFMALDLAGNCATQDVIVTILDTIPPTMTCPDDIVTADCGAPVLYDQPIGEDACGNVTTSLLEGLPSGTVFPTGISTVTWVGDDPNGNSGMCSFQVTVQSDLKVDSMDITEPSCFGFDDGTATALPSGGTGIYSYLWNNFDTTQTLTGLPAGDYEVTVTDDNGCEAIGTLALTQPDSIDIAIDEIIPETGANQMNGSISISVSGGSGGGFTYEWLFLGQTISTDEDLSGLSAGDYTVIVTDDSGCVDSTDVFVDFMTGTFDSELVENIILNPNPTDGIFLLDIELSATSEVKIDVFNYTGQRIRKGISESILNKKYDFDLSDFPEGVYLVRIIIHDLIISRKVLVSKY